MRKIIYIITALFISVPAFAQDEPANEPKYLVLAPAAIAAQLSVVNQAFGVEKEDGSKPYATQNVFQVIRHPTQPNRAAIVIVPVAGFKGAELGNGRAASVSESVNRLFVTNKPLTDHATMLETGWFESTGGP